MSEGTLAPWQRSLILGAQRLIYWLTKHWLALANLSILVFFVALPSAAPLFMKAGWTGPARTLYTIYGSLCHQLSFRSWFLFGERAVYPRAEYVERVGLSDANWTEQFAQARALIGDETLGYKVALCQRDIAIYVALLLAGVVYAFLRRRGLRAMPFWLFILGGVLPIALDGGSQFVSLVIPAFPARESVWQLRTLTGALFGFAIAWLAYPYIQEGMDETRQLLAARYGWDGHTRRSEPTRQTNRDQVMQMLRDRQEDGQH